MGSVIRMSWSVMGGKLRDCRGSVKAERGLGQHCICTVSCALCPSKTHSQFLRLEWFATIKTYYSARRIRLLGSSIGPSCSGHGDTLILVPVRQIGAMNPVGISAVRSSRDAEPDGESVRVRVRVRIKFSIDHLMRGRKLEKYRRVSKGASGQFR